MNNNEKRWIDDHAADGERVDAAQEQEDHQSMVESAVDRKIFAEMENAKMETIKVARITLLYTCHPCNERASQALGQIIESGTAICPECDNDMQLDDSVDISADPAADGPSVAEMRETIAEFEARDYDRQIGGD